MGYHLARYGLMGHLGHFSSVESILYPRNTRVILRTERGLEMGLVLASPGENGAESSKQGEILRRVTVEDELLAARLEEHRHKAFQSCQQLLLDRKIPAVLVDVEHLFDGKGLFFYFLGDVPAETNQVLDQLAQTYKTVVELRRFTETLTNGCGPGCGTEEAMGQGGCDSCSGCAVASACGVKQG